MHDAMGALPESGQQSVSKLDGCFGNDELPSGRTTENFYQSCSPPPLASTFPHMRGREMDAG
jgi:hypothetical protein